MAKTAKTLNVNLDVKAYDIIYDSAQKCGLSVTAFIEGFAYHVAAQKKQGKDVLLTLIMNAKEPVQ